jgi:hypothetical protein
MSILLFWGKRVKHLAPYKLPTQRNGLLEVDHSSAPETSLSILASAPSVHLSIPPVCANHGRHLCIYKHEF